MAAIYKTLGQSIVCSVSFALERKNSTVQHKAHPTCAVSSLPTGSAEGNTAVTHISMR